MLLPDEINRRHAAKTHVGHAEAQQERRSARRQRLTSLPDPFFVLATHKDPLEQKAPTRCR